MRLVLFAAAAALSCTGAPAPHHNDPDCRVSAQSKTPPYTITVTCHPDCRHIPKLPTVHQLIAEGVDPEAAQGVAQIQSGFWRRACPSKHPPSN